MADTIFALSSGAVPSGVAVIRVSGPGTREIVETLAGKVPQPRKTMLAKLRDPETKDVLDEALVLYFEGPSSFTGEDVAESNAMVDAPLSQASCPYFPVFPIAVRPRQGSSRAALLIVAAWI